MKHKQEEEVNASEWLNTYADMVTLLLCFFVLLYSISNVDKEKYMVVAQAIASEITNEAKSVKQSTAANTPLEGVALIDGQAGAEEITSEKPTDFDMLYLYVKNYVQEQNMQEKIEVYKGNGYVFIRFKDSMFFNPDSSLLKKDSVKTLEFLGGGLKNVEAQIQSIRIDGHTADVPGITNYHISDRKLSSDRANSVLAYFEDTIKITPTLLVSTGYGKNRPIAENTTAEGRAKNRRVELLIIKKDDGTSDADLNQLVQQYFNGEALDFNVDYTP